MSNFSFLVYRSSDEDVSVNAIVKDESVWLSQKAMAELFGVSKSTISRHLKPGFPRYVTSHLTAFPQLSIFRSSQQRYNP